MRVLIEENAAISRDDFVARYQHPFLIQLSQAQQKAVDSGFFTAKGNSSTAKTDLSLIDNSVVSVVKRSQKTFKNLFSIGRTLNNDVALPFASVSKFHAYFQLKEGQWFVTDGNSSNGTFLDGLELEPTKPYPLSSGNCLSFSRNCVVLFVLPPAMFEYITALKKLHQIGA